MQRLGYIEQKLQRVQSDRQNDSDLTENREQDISIVNHLEQTIKLNLFQ